VSEHQESRANHNHGDVRRFAERLRSRAMLAEFLGELSLHAAVGLAFAGILVLAARGLFGWERLPASWAFAILAFAPVTAFLRSRQRFLSEGGALGWLDVRTGATGTLLASVEVQDSRWSSRVAELLRRSPPPPAIRWRPLARRAAPCLIFALAALAVPIARAEGAASIGERSLARLQEKLQALQEEVRIEETPAAEIKERLDQLRSELAEARLETQLEAADRLDAAIDKEAQKAAESAQQAMEQLAEAGADARKDAGEAQRELEQAVAELAKNGLTKGLEEKMLKSGFGENAQLPEGTKLDPAQIQKMSEEMRQALAEKLASLEKKGLSQKGKPTKGNGKKEKIDWDNFEDHKCTPECKEGGS
jgi:hypothetical protein